VPLSAQTLDGGSAGLSYGARSTDVGVMALLTQVNRNWLTDPAGWAEDALSKRSSYISLQVLCVFGGLLCCAAIRIPLSRLSVALPNVGLPQIWGLYALAFVFATILPLIYLRAARALALKCLHER
jgi:hypothetical protein